MPTGFDFARFWAGPAERTDSDRARRQKLEEVRQLLAEIAVARHSDEQDPPAPRKLPPQPIVSASCERVPCETVHQRRAA